MKAPVTIGAAATALLAACNSVDVSDVPKIPGPSKKVTQTETIEIARAYAKLEWTPEERHAYHGKDPHMISIHTPDAAFRKSGIRPGYWKAGRTQSGMPYKWGGFDTPRSFARGLHKGRYAGDVATDEKRQLKKMAASPAAVGIDCSGFVSRCWRLKKPYSTRDLHKICDQLSSYEHLQTGDILNLHDKHVLLFSHWVVPDEIMYVYEASAYPEWKVSGNRVMAKWLENEGYLAFRYENMREAHPEHRKSRPEQKDDVLLAVAKEPENPVADIVRDDEKGWWLPELVSSIGGLFDALNPLGNDRAKAASESAIKERRSFRKSAASRRR